MNGLGRVWVIRSFGLGGLFSVFLLSVCLHLPIVGKWIAFLLVGTVFGACMAVCFWAYLRPSAWRISLFLAASMVAFHLAVVSVDFYSHLLVFDSLRKGWGPGQDAFFVGGAVGAFVVLTSTFLLFFDAQPLWRLLLKSISWSLIGGALGAVGDQLDTSFATAYASWWLPFGNELPLYFIWQTGMGVVLGSILQFQRRASYQSNDKMSPGRRSPASFTVARYLFFGTILVLLVYFVIWEVHAHYVLARGAR